MAKADDKACWVSLARTPMTCLASRSVDAVLRALVQSVAANGRLGEGEV